MTTTPTLKNPLRVLDIWALGVGIVVCGQYFGWNLGLVQGGPVGMLVASLIVCLLFLIWVLTLAELAVAMPRAGGPLEYGERVGGPWLGFLLAWSMLLECLFGTVATALATAWYVAFLFDPIQPNNPTIIVTAGLSTVVLFFFLHAWGVKEQSLALVLMTYAAIGALVMYWCVAGSNFSWTRAWPAADPLVGKGWKSVLDAIPYALWWLIIIEGVALAAEETHEPHRSIPRGLVWAMITVIGMAVLTLGLTAGAWPWHEVTDPYPLAKLVLDVTGGEPIWLFYTFGTVALFGLIASYHGLLYSTSRQAFALGRANCLPAWFGSVHATRRTPVPALLVCSVVAAAFVIASVEYKESIEIAILVAGLAALILYILAMLCLLRLRLREPGLFCRYRAPLGLLLPVAVILLSGFAIAVYVDTENGYMVLLIGAALYALGLGFFAFRSVRTGNASSQSSEVQLAGQLTAMRRSTGLLDILASAWLVVSLLTVAWIAATAYQPEWLRLASLEAEIVICIVVFGVTLGLISAVAIAHTQPKHVSGPEAINQ